MTRGEGIPEYVMAKQTEKSQKFKMTFPKKVVGEPIVQRLSEEMNVSANILRGRVTDKSGWMEVEITGAPESIREALKHLDSIGVKVQELED